MFDDSTSKDAPSLPALRLDRALSDVVASAVDEVWLLLLVDVDGAVDPDPALPCEELDPVLPCEELDPGGRPPT